METCKYHPYIDDYINGIESGRIVASKDIILAMAYVKTKLDNPDVIIKSDMIEKAVELTERYFETKLVDWELFIMALIHCYYKTTDMVVISEYLIVMGRGNGKNGFISLLSWYLTTHYHGVREYNIDIIANSEKQAKTSFEDVYNVLERTWAKSKKFFYKTKEVIVNLKTKSYIRFNTSNADTKDGGRPGCLIFDEIHNYEVFDTISVFTSGFGKKKHSRTFYITTNGRVRGGVLDQQMEIAKDVLNGTIKNMRLLPLIYRIDKKEDAEDPAMWPKANPSLLYFPLLKGEMDDEFIKMKYQPTVAIEFMTKRMNFPSDDNYSVIAPWEKILATNKPIPYDELEGLECIGAIDFAQVKDFCSVGLLFKYKGMRYFIEHTFVCHLALEVESRKIKFPVQEMADRGLITIIKEDLIGANVIADWFLIQAKKYNIKTIACDTFRASLLESKFTEEGLPLQVVRSGPITHSKVAVLIEVMFAEETIVFGDNPTMRWAINNSYQSMCAKGNITYLKIEPQTRKTDSFFALIHALSLDSELIETNNDIMTFDVYTY